MPEENVAITEKSHVAHVASESLDIEVKCATQLSFTEEDDFRLGERNDLVRALGLDTCGILGSSHLYIEQRLIGNAMADDPTRGLGGSVCICYTQRYETVEGVPTKGFLDYVCKEHWKIIDAINDAWRDKRRLPDEVGGMRRV